MRLRVPYLIQDPQITAAKGLTSPVEFREFDGEAFCLDGPVTRRLAILDFDDDTGALRPGVPFVAAFEPDKPSGYAIVDADDLMADDFLRVNVFTTALSTLYMFEEKDVLGREVAWAFGAPQLLVIPRAGEWANAFYQRESHSLQFFYFPSVRARANTVFTALSQDIIAHETAHAILDGIAPDLYNSLTPQSLALHEAVADLTALLTGLRSRRLREQLLEQTGGSISGRNALSSMAEQFGLERDVTGRARDLRSLWNERNLDPDDDTLDELNRRNQATRAEPHLLSEVLSGALYRVFARLHDEYKSRRAAEKNITEFSASGFALFVAREHFKRLALRSLDYLPPGEISFADYGRAILASDQASYEKQSLGRDELVAEFVRRHIVADSGELAVETNFEHPAVQGIDLEALTGSDWAAYDFADRQRAFLGIPPAVHFRVRPRLRARKEYWTPDGPEMVEECIFKVSWDRTEQNPGDLPLPALRQITVGTTLVIDWQTGRVRALLQSDAARAPETTPADRYPGTQQHDRDEMLRSLVRGHRLAFGPEADDEPLFRTAARVEVSGELMRIRASGRMLHMADDHEDHG